MKKIALIGSTGSIGRQVLRVAERHPDEFRVVAIAANSPSAEFDRQIAVLSPEVSALASTDREGALHIAGYPAADLVFNAAGGFAGLEYSLRALAAGKPLALANKESLVCGSELLLPLAKEKGAEIIPVDSEHSAIWQCLHFQKKAAVRRLIITASGGAFRGKNLAELERVTPAEALCHPTWHMGAKITIDSATLMNKGYEVLEAHALYGTPYDRIEAVIQPQSIVHSLVEFDDGALLAQMSYPTMEIPIQLALSYPERLDTEVLPMDFTRAFSLDFTPFGRGAYPLYDLALECGRQGGTAPCILNAADEIAVGAFLQGKLSFPRIYAVVSEVLNALPSEEITDYPALAEADKAARRAAQKIIDRST